MTDSPTVRSAAVYARSGAASLTQIEYQVRDCRKLADARGWEVGEVYADNGWSGMNFERPAYQRMIEDIHAGLRDAVIVDRPETLSRSVADRAFFLTICRAAGVRFVMLVDDTAALIAPDEQ